MDRLARPSTRYVKSEDGIYLGYQVFGDGPYDLVINDGTLSNIDANWDLPMYARYLRTLAERARLIVFDRRGSGVSDRPTSLETLSLEKGMDDMRTVMDEVGIAAAPSFWGSRTAAP